MNINDVIEKLYKKNKFVNKYLSKKIGLNEEKSKAIELLDKIYNIFNEYNITNFLMCGALLGLVRNNDFIPWDDDIDLIISSDIYKAIDIISEKYKNELVFEKISNHFIKVYFSDVKSFPFIDLFIYEEDDSNVYYFGKTWDKNKIFPLEKILFNDIYINIPKDSTYCLSRNFGDDYMIKIVSSKYNHRESHCHSYRVTVTMSEKYVYVFVKHVINTYEKYNFKYLISEL